MSVSLGAFMTSVGKIFDVKQDGTSCHGEIGVSPLDGRLPDVTTQELRATGKSAARLRTEKHTGSIIDWVEVQFEDRISKPGREVG